MAGNDAHMSATGPSDSESDTLPVHDPVMDSTEVNLRSNGSNKIGDDGLASDGAQPASVLNGHQKELEASNIVDMDEDGEQGLFGSASEDENEG